MVGPHIQHNASAAAQRRLIAYFEDTTPSADRGVAGRRMGWDRYFQMSTVGSLEHWDVLQTVPNQAKNSNGMSDTPRRQRREDPDDVDRM
jgi:hypothetical protein